jgi:glutathione peroxidase
MGSIKYFFLRIFGKKEIISKPPSVKPMNASFYDLSMQSLDGREIISFTRYKGKNVLLVNTASECGFTPQYTELQELHEKYGDKIVVLGFPANNFGGQEPGSNEEIGAFCQKNFGVTFQLFERSDVFGANQNPVYRWLSDKSQNGWNKEKPSWNFCKYLVNEKGELLKFYSAAISPLSNEILDLL